MAGMFDSSNKVATKAPSASKSKTPVHAVEGILRLAGSTVLEKTGKTLKETAQASVKSIMSEMFADFGMKAGKAPESFKGVEPGHEDEASSSCQLRARPKTSPLSPDEIATLTDYGFPIEDNVITVDTFVINPEHVNDEKVLNVMQKLLAPAQASGKLPADLFQKQDGLTTKVLPADALDHLFKTYAFVHGDDKKNTRNRAIVTDLLPICGVLATGSVKLAKDELSDTIAFLGSDMEDHELALTIKKLQAIADGRSNAKAAMNAPVSRKGK